MAAFRCSEAARARCDPLAGTATQVLTWLLLEDPGPWGEDAWRDARLPEGLGPTMLRRIRGTGIRPLLVRRPRRLSRGTPGEKRRAWVASSRLDGLRLESTELDDPRALLDLDLAAIGRGATAGWPLTDEPFFGVCTHGRHDACCAIRGRPVAQALARTEPDCTWEISHIGGDRFAANLLVLPEGLYYGQVEPDRAADVAATHRRGEVTPDLLRGRSAWAMPVQAAAVELRHHTGIRELHGIRPLATSRTAQGWLTTWATRSPERKWTVAVERLAPPATRLTCSADHEDIPWEFRAATPEPLP